MTTPVEIFILIVSRVFGMVFRSSIMIPLPELRKKLTFYGTISLQIFHQLTPAHTLLFAFAQAAQRLLTS